MKKKKKRSGRGARLGQHFLTASWAARALAQAAAVRYGETILEIGPGRGALTRELLRTGARVVAIEKDEALAAELRAAFALEIAGGGLRIVRADIRDARLERLRLGRYVVAANIPYYLTGEIIRRFLTAHPQPRAMILLVQKEVAERVVARGGKENVLSLSVKAYGAPRIVERVPRGNFSPPPSVDSAILAIEGVSRDFFADAGEEHFFHVVRAGFASKRKLLASNLARAFGREAASSVLAAGIAANARAEDVPLAAWKRLALLLARFRQAGGALPIIAPASAPKTAPNRSPSRYLARATCARSKIPDSPAGRKG